MNLEGNQRHLFDYIQTPEDADLVHLIKSVDIVCCAIH